METSTPDTATPPAPDSRLRRLRQRFAGRFTLTEKAWRIVATVQAMSTAGLTAAWVLLGAPQDYGDLPRWFQIVLPIQMALIIAWVVVGARAERR
jgi:hypothetical protein